MIMSESFSNYILNEKSANRSGKRSHTFSNRKITLQIEQVLVDVINGKKPTYPSLEKTALKVFSILRKKGMDIGHSASYYGSSKNSAPLSKHYLGLLANLYPDYNPKSSNTTPKTDLFTNNGKYSLKCHEGFLFAHQLIDTSICFHYMIDKDKGLQRKALDAIISNLKQLQHKELTNPKTENSSTTFVDSVRDKCVELFNVDSIKKEFIKYGVSGEFKYGNSMGTADNMFVIKYIKDEKSQIALRNPDFISDNTYITPIHNDRWLDSIVKVARPTFLLETSGKYRFDLKAPNHKYTENSLYYNESIYLEGVLDSISKSIMSGAKTIKTYFDKLLNFIILTFKEGFSKFMNVFGLTTDIELDNYITFPDLA